MPTVKIIRQANLDNFSRLLEEQYTTLFATDPEYAYSAAHTTPKSLAIKITYGLLQGSANKDGKAIKKACAMIGIKHTYKAMREYLAEVSEVSETA